MKIDADYLLSEMRTYLGRWKAPCEPDDMIALMIDLVECHKARAELAETKELLEKVK